MPWNRTQHQGLRVGLRTAQSYGGATRKRGGSTLFGCPLVQGGVKVDWDSAATVRAGVWPSTGNWPVLATSVTPGEGPIRVGLGNLLASSDAGEEIVDTATSLQPWARHGRGYGSGVVCGAAHTRISADFKLQTKLFKTRKCSFPTNLM